jgi:hypothetical protein
MVIGQHVGIFARIHDPRHVQLLFVIHAVGHQGALLGMRENREKHGRQNSNDSNDDQEFD